MTDHASLPSPERFAHSHDFLGRGHDRNARRTLLVVALTAVMMVAEIVAGYATGSMALLADGFHMGTHAGALGIAAFAYAYARRHAGDPRYSFGTGKVGDLAGFASAVILGLVALGIGVESVQRLFDPVGVAFDEAIVVAVIGLAVNLASAVLLGHGHDHGRGHGHGHAHHHHDHGHDHDHHHHDHARGGGDNNLRAAYMHVLADALTSVFAIAALLAGRFAGWVWLDPVMGIVGALVIMRWSVVLLKDTAGVLLDRTDPALVGEIRESVEAPGDARVCDLHVWRVGPEAHAAIVSVVAGPGLDCEAVRARLAPVHELAHVTVECRAAA